MKVREPVTIELLADEQQVFDLLYILSAGRDLRSWEVVDEDGRLYLDLTLKETP